MQRWSRLNEQQLAVLRRIGDADDSVSARNPDLATTVYALRNRGLVTTPRRDGIWHAEITDAGRFYLEHGRHPDQPNKQAPTRSTTGKQVKRGRPDKAAELLDQLSRSSGTLRIQDPDPDVRAAYRRAINAAKRRDLVPSGSQLLDTGRDSGDLVIKFAEAGEEVEAEWNRLRKRAREEQSDAEMFAVLEADPTVIDVSAEARPRALRLLKTLADKADKKGYRVALSRKTRQLHIRVRDHQYRIRVSEERDEVPRPLPPDDWRLQDGYSWQRITPREYDLVPSGRLRIEVPGLRGEGPDHWVDAGRKKIEGNLLDVLEAMERCVDRADQQQAFRQRQHEALLAAQERQRVEEEERAEIRRRQWEAAMTKARELAVDRLRQQTFHDAFADWVAAGEIREFCTALQESAAAHGQSITVQSWIDWANALADRLDPAMRPAEFAAMYDLQPGPDDLRPYLGDWSPHRPEKEYRPSSPPESRPVRNAPSASDWRWGRPGRAPWWLR